MKTYAGKIVKSERQVWVKENNVVRQLDPCLDVINHSATFHWGQGSSPSPAQLAFALLADFFGDKKKALCFYQHFKEDVIVKLDSDKNWVLNSDDIAEAVTEIENKCKHNYR